MSITTNSVTIISKYLVDVYKRITNTIAPIRRINISCNNVIDECYEQYDLFTNPAEIEKERNMQHAVLSIKSKYGKTAIMKGMNLLDAGTTKDRLHQIGGHKSGN